MDKREQTRKVRQTADLVEGYLDALTEYAEADLTTANVDEVAEAAEHTSELIRRSARNAVELATGGTPTCKRHANRAVAAHSEAVDLAATVRRAVEVERLRRAEAAHADRTMLERDYPALAAVVAVDPDDHAWLRRAVALVTADDYREVMDAMWRFRPSLGWDEVAMPSPDALADFITEDADARELAGVILAYAEAAEPLLPGILAESELAGWLMPEEAYPDESVADSLADGYAHPVHGGTDDRAVGEACALAVSRYGIFDDVNNPEDYLVRWEAHVLPGVPVWLPHVEAWRRDMPVADDVLVARQIDRSLGYWEDAGRDDYLCAYAEAYVEAILDAETPATVGEDWDSGIDPEDRRAEAVERAQAAVAELGEVSAGDVEFASLAPGADEIIEQAERDARDDYRLSAHRARGPVSTIPLF